MGAVYFLFIPEEACAGWRYTILHQDIQLLLIIFVQTAIRTRVQKAVIGLSLDEQDCPQYIKVTVIEKIRQ